MRVQLYGWWGGYDAQGREIAATEPAHLLVALRDLRDVLLKECDHTQTPDIPVSEEVRTAWRDWRQMLRDLPAHYTEDNIPQVLELPDPPEAMRPPSWINLDPQVVAARIAAQEAARDAEAAAQRAAIEEAIAAQQAAAATPPTLEAVTEGAE